MRPVDLTGLRVISQRNVEEAAAKGAKEIVIRQGAVVTPSAMDALQRRAVATRTAVADAGAAPAGRTGARQPAPTPAAASAAALALFNSPEAEKIKAEIVTTGKKLWHRQYVDGNGGNISYRIGPNEVICTPTLCSKFDLRPEELCMVDLDGNQLVGDRPRTSEILLHLEIYKAVPKAKGVVHCHPPHATAYAITGRVPPTAIIPEYDVFVGAVAVSPYETPGTKKFAQTVLPFVQNYNTVLLANHGIVCWADTVTHAEWYAEVLETYCWTLMLATQLGAPVSRIPAAKTTDLLDIKKRLGLPDPRFHPGECPLAEDLDQPVGGIALPPPSPCRCRGGDEACGDGQDAGEVDAIVREVTEAVMAALETRGRRR
jgi:L-fuculose-phosphate aldolase